MNELGKNYFGSLMPWVVCKANLFVQFGNGMSNIRGHTCILFMLIQERQISNPVVRF